MIFTPRLVFWSSPQKVVHLLVWEINPIRNKKGGLKWLKKRYKPEEIVIKLRQVEVLQSQGMVVSEAIRQIGVSEVTYYRWRKEYRGMAIHQLKRLKEVEKENQRLRKAVSDLT